MKKSLQNFWLNLVLFVGAVMMAVSGFVLWFVLPRGSGGGGQGLGRGYGWGSGGGFENTFLLARHDWLTLHGWAAVGLAILVLVHLALHYKWILHVLKRLFRPRRAKTLLIPQDITSPQTG